jgi:hypothetical protein
MTADFFAGFQTVAEIKTRYRELARQFHPDLGGCLETMKAINCQYHARLKGESGKEFDGHKYTYNNKTEQEIMDKIADLVKLQDLQVDLIGLWIWIRGNTKPQRDALKALGCRWHSGRLCWYWKPEWMGRSRSNPGSLDELARKYGCQGFTSKGPVKLANA